MSEHPPEPVHSEMPGPRPPAHARRRGFRKAGRVLWLVFLSFLGFLVLAVGSALVWLHTQSGIEELGKLVTDQARAAIQGDLKIRGVQVRGFIRICAQNVELRDPDDHKVASADRACISLSPLALVRHQIVLREVELEKPWLEIASIPGTKDTTLSRALAPKKVAGEKEPAQGGFQWVVDVRDIKLRQGSVALRPAIGEPATFALSDLDISDAHALYAQDAAAAKLELAGQLAAPGKAKVAFDVDASVQGPAATGIVSLRSLHAHVGESALAASGSWDLSKMSGELHLTDIVANPREVDAFLPKREGPKLLLGAVRGSAIVKSDGHTAQVELQLSLPKGKLQARATGTLEKDPRWDLQLYVDKLDPGATTGLAPKGEITARASIHGKGAPRFDEHGVKGTFEGVVHIGPAHVERMGEIAADLEASIEGRQGLIKAFTATALGLQVKAHGEAAYDALKMDLFVDAPDLAAVGKAVGVLTRKPPTPIAGALKLNAHLTGSPRRPDANLHLRAPRFRFGPTLAIDGLAVDGGLHGRIETPDGQLTLAAQRLVAGAVDLGAPRVAMDLEWPVAHLRIGAGVQGGALSVVGDATIDDDKDGLRLSNFVVTYPGNELRLARQSNVHFRDEVVVDPIELNGPHGGVRFQARLQEPPGRVDAHFAISRLDLAYLPSFALPKDLGLHGVVDLDAVAQGPRAAPDLEVKLDVARAGAKPAGNLDVDAHLHGKVQKGRLQTEGQVTSGRLLRFDWNGQLPVEGLQHLADSTPIQLDAHLASIDVARLAETAKIEKLSAHKAHGEVRASLSIQGSLGNPKATLSLDGHGLGADAVRDVGAQTGLLLDKSKVALDARMSLGDAQVLGLTAEAPFELRRALRDKTYLQSAIERPLKMTLAVTQLDLARLANAGVLPAGSAGTVSLTAHLSGTPLKPTLKVVTAGQNVSSGRLHGLGFQGQLDVGPKVKLTFGAQSGPDVVARLDTDASLSGGEVVEILRRRDDPDAIAPLLDRQVGLTLEIPGLPIARASQLAGRSSSVAEGRVVGRVTLAGTPARPRLKGQISIKDVSAQKTQLGSADLDLDADDAGAVLHLGLDPPGGGTFVAKAKLKADLGARTLLREGGESITSGYLDAELTAKKLDLAFLSGLVPRVRRAAGTLDMEVKASGPPLKALPTGEAHLKGGVAEIIGQGVYEDVGLDANFSPKEVVIDRITGTTGPGTFSTVLVASRKPNSDPSVPDAFEFSGEIHLGDAESVRDRKRADGTPLRAGAVPVRQAGEQRADVTAEVDLFGDYSDGLLHASAKIPEARIVIQGLPDKKLPKLKPNPDIEIIEPGHRPHPPDETAEEADAEEEAKKTANLRAHAKLDIVHLYVKAEDFEFPLETNLTFDYDAQHPDAPSADGTIHVPNGSFNALGRRFSILDAKITETGGDITDPELEVKALFENPQANVTITVSGSAQSPQLEMTSNPPMDQDAIAFFLATGRIQGRATQSGGGVDLSGAATSVLGSLLFGQVRKELASVLPVDVLTIDTSTQEASVGKYIGDRIFIGYRQRLTTAPNENTSEGRIEYEFNRSVSAEATLGDRNSDVSVLYTKDF